MARSASEDLESTAVAAEGGELLEPVDLERVVGRVGPDPALALAGVAPVLHDHVGARPGALAQPADLVWQRVEPCLALGDVLGGSAGGDRLDEADALDGQGLGAGLRDLATLSQLLLVRGAARGAGVGEVRGS